MKNTKAIDFKPLTATDGNRAEAVNVRRRGDWMEVVGEPAAVCPKTSDDQLLGADIRGTRTFYFMQSRHRAVSVTGYSERGKFTAVGQEMFDAEGDIIDFAVSGDFVVLSSAHGLRYLHFNGSGYDYLGGMPEMPVLAFGTIDIAAISTDIPGATLKGSYPQWKGTLSAADYSSVERALTTGIKQLQTAAAAGGGCLQPVTIRTALRLWDDSLLWSDAVCNLGAVWNPDALAEATGGDNWTTASTTLSATMWQPTLRLVSAGLGAWQPLVKAVEIYATDDTTAFATIRLRCEQSQTGQKSYYLRMRAENDAAAMLRRMAEAKKMRLVASITDTAALMDGKIVGSNIEDVGNGVYAIVIARSTTETEWRSAPRRFVANTLSNVGTSLFAGNLVSQMPEAPQFLSLADTTTLTEGMASAYVSVDIATASGTETVTRAALLEHYSLRTTNLVAYPDNRARRLSLAVTAGGKRYGASINLTPASCGNYAYAVQHGGFQLQLSAETGVHPTTAVAERQPSTLLYSAGNPLQWAVCERADNTGVVGVVPTLRYGSSWVVGRTPACLLSSDGIRLLSFDTSGRCTASTRISQRVVASQRLAAVTERGLAFVDSRGELCRYEGSRVTPTGIVFKDAEGMVYAATYGELLIYGGSTTLAVSADNTYTRRSHAYGSHSCGLVCDSNSVYDPGDEQRGMMAVDMRTPQIEMAQRCRLALWHIDATEADVRATVYAENGYSCHGGMVARLRLRGPICAAVRQRVAMPASRTMRFELQGTLPSGSRICRIKLS